MMTQEAIKKLKNIYDSNNPFMHGRRIEIETAISALEKQIPKKPKILTWQLLIDSGWKHECPNCGCAVGVNKNLGFAYEEYLEPNESYCCSCGQALDWSDTE